jgi:hypothetical protein
MAGLYPPYAGVWLTIGLVVSAELQVNALDVLRSVKDLFKEGAFLGEPAVKSAPLAPPLAL